MLALSLSLWLSAADLRACAEAEIAQAPEKLRAGLTLALDGKGKEPSLDAREQTAMAERDRRYALLLVAEEAARQGDRARAARIARQMEADFIAQPPKYAPSAAAHLACAFAVAGESEPARKHLAAAQTALKDSTPVTAHRELLLVALALGDAALAKAEEDAFFAAVAERRPGDRLSDVLVAARDLAYAGHARRALAFGVRVKEDAVLDAALEGVKARHDLPVALEIIGAMSSARAQFLALQQLRFAFDDRQRRTAPYLALVRSVLAREPDFADDVDGYARGQLVEALADVGLAKDAVAVTTRMRRPWQRARAEAVAAQALAVADPKAALALARAALARAATPGFRTSVVNDTMEIDAARYAAVAALARAGALDEARKAGSPSDFDTAIGLRGDPKAFAAWWKERPPEVRARILVSGARADPELGDWSFLAAVCPSP